jgi:hypothetical protein
MQEVKFIAKESQEELLKLAEENDRLYTTIGGLEVRKAEVINRIMNLRFELDKKAKESIIASGVDENEVEKFKIDIKTGEIKTREES